MNRTFQALYKRDSKGKVRIWFMEQDGDKYRTFDGIDGGTVKSSAWRVAKPTNVGRSNERDGIAQASFEIDAAYTKQLKGAYYERVEDIDLGCRYFEPMLADKYSKFEPGYAQPKLDGIRAIIDRGGVWSREGDPLPGGMHIWAALQPVFEKSPALRLDGELYNHDLRDDFNELVSLIKKGAPSPDREAEIISKVQFHTYDMPSVVGPFSTRASYLERLVTAINNPSILFVPTTMVNTQAEFDFLHGSFVAQGYEGSMWRCPKTDYEVGRRSKSLRKRKDFDDAEFELIPDGIEEGEGNWAGAAKRAVFWLPNADRSIDLTDKKARAANTFETGLRGDYQANAKILRERDDYKIATVRFFGWTPSEIPKPRFGVVTAFYGAARTI